MTRRRSPLDSRNGFSTFVPLLLVQQGVATKRDGTEAVWWSYLPSGVGMVATTQIRFF